MDSSTREIYYQKMKEMIFDEDKIITTSSLIKDLEISIDTAKLLLKSFIEDQRQINKSTELGVTFLLSGLLKNGNKLCVSLCEEKKLEEKRNLFNEIQLEEIYSVQKGKNIDYNSIALVNENSENDFKKAGFVLSKNYVKRVLKKPQIVEEKPSTSSKPKNFFQKIPPTTQKPQITPTNNKEKEETTVKKPENKPKNGAMANFLSKGSSASANKVNKENKNDENKQIKQEPPKIEKKKEKQDKNDVENMNIDVELKEEPVKTTKSKTTSNNKRKKSSKNEPPAKKRKRIQDFGDSDSSDMFGESEHEEDIIDKSDEEPPVKVEVKEEIPEKVKGRRRKAVDKTFLDEEGFLVTTTEYVFETASEDETPSPPPAPKPKPTLLKKNSTTDSETDTKDGKKSKNSKKKQPAANQPTLMNFFKKK